MYHSSTCLLALFTLLPAVDAGFLRFTSEEGCVKGIKVEEGGDYTNWPELFRLTSPNPDDPTLPNRGDTVDPKVLLAAGVEFHFLDPSGFTYPNRTKEIPWSPPANRTNDPALAQLRSESDYQYADIVVVTAYNEKFYEEHIHSGGDEVRYVIDGSGFFDIRDVNDEWIRMHAPVGAFIVFPSGIEHRFAVDENMYVQAMRLFPGSAAPDWSSVPRNETNGNVTARNEYAEKYLCGVDPDLDDHGHDHGHEEQDHSMEGEKEDDDHDGKDNMESMKNDSNTTGTSPATTIIGSTTTIILSSIIGTLLAITAL
mmetsp:Transcript_15208/g.17539  ORF Transcript_15208/g.17539 Transcript_15208/m.17539 type:complete len:312 (+) Transcript_15208:219-1154(+)